MSFKFDTRAIHAGQPNDKETGAVTFPIYQTSTFAQSEPGVHTGFNYARSANPTRQALEECIASLEEAKYGIAFASGIAAVQAALNTLKAGDHVITCADLYGGSYRIFTKVYSKFDIEFTFIDTTDPTNVKKAIKDNTALLWLETPSNPLLNVTDIAACSAIAKEHGITVVADNTFASPYLQSPLKLGADIVLHSTTKFINGHSDVIGGALLTNSDELGEQLKFIQNSAGSVPGPQDCFLILRGLKTLSVRMDRHCDNAERVAKHLEGHPDVARVFYPGLESHPGYEVAKRQQKRPGAMVSFELKQGFEAARAFTSNTEVFTLAESLGSVQSLCNHPATMTHASVEPEVRHENGIEDGLVRLSVGIEDIDDLLADLDQALAKVKDIKACNCNC